MHLRNRVFHELGHKTVLTEVTISLAATEALLISLPAHTASRHPAAWLTGPSNSLDARHE